LESQRDGLFDNVEMKMERAVAIKVLGKLLGKKLGYRVDDKAPTKEERAEARAALTQAIEERNKMNEQRDARYKAILAADEEYQRLFAEAKAARKRTDELSSITRHYKITVGTSEGMFFMVRAEGDTWEEIIAKLTLEA
jgi:membrane-associated HD superfamily phosphohydrolase